MKKRTATSSVLVNRIVIAMAGSNAMKMRTATSTALVNRIVVRGRNSKEKGYY